MGQALKMGSINQIEGGSVIYREGERLNSIALILKGNAVSFNAGYRVMLGPGDFVALNDLYIGNYSCTTMASTGCAFYVFEAKGLDDIPAILEQKQEYKGYVIKSLNRVLAGMYESYYSVLSVANDVLARAKETMETYKEIVSSYGEEPERVYVLEGLERYEKMLPVKEEWAQMIGELQAVPAEIVASYYSYIPNTALHEIEEKIKISTILMNSLKMLPSFVGKVAGSLITEGGDCVFKAICRTVMTLAPSHANYKEMIQLLDQTVELVNILEKELEERYGENSLISRGPMEQLYFSILSGADEGEDMLDQEITGEEIARLFENSLDQILSYGEIEQEIREQYTALMDQFVALRDKNSTDEEVRALRHSLISVFFYIYKRVFLKAYTTGEYSKPVGLFLHFGFMDERLLSKEQITELYRLRIKNTATHYCNCYTMYDWFVEIYEGRKEPSKNEMDMDYRDHIRQMYGKGKLTVQEERTYMEDYDAKLEFELSNMFQHNMRLTSGKVSTYVPFLYADMMPMAIEKYFMTPTKVDEALRDILKIDFSVFYREIVYSNEAVGVPRELIQKECLPDILLFPSSGSVGVMWQETANKMRDSAARFCLPILLEANLSNLMIHLVGRFRWELCRTLQGMSWNDIKNKCLTSEYNDYIQFFRKNKELTEEKREKVKQQIQRARSSTRECFVMDYEQWIKYEVTGSVRLNTCARDILSHYCPFTKEIRDKLSERPQYADGFAKYDREVKAKARILDAKLFGIRKKGLEVPKELELTAAYYHKK